MTIDEIKGQVRSVINSSFAGFTIRFESIGEDLHHIGVDVFGVPRELVHHVEDRILDLDAKFCGGTPFILTPLVRDERTTDKMYPEYASPWQPARSIQLLLCTPQAKHSPIERLVASQHGEWVSLAIYGAAANEELALAA